MCKLTSIDRLWLSKLKYFEIMIRCEEELTGKNSVMPWIKESINISTKAISIFEKYYRRN